jgi:hypothetical protein
MAPLCYRRHRFPPEIIRHAIWLYLRFTLSYRDVEKLLAERGLDISYETGNPRSQRPCCTCRRTIIGHLLTPLRVSAAKRGKMDATPSRQKP